MQVHNSVINSLQGSITTSGIYTAPQVPGVYEVTVADSSTPALTSKAQVIASLDVTFALANTVMQVNETLDFTSKINGGSGNPANYELTASSGTVSGLSYTAPASAGPVVLKVKDNSYSPPSVAHHNFSYDTLAISPSTLSLAVGNTFGFAASGGVAPYSFSLQLGAGQITSNGQYTASSTTGSAIVRVTDARNHTTTSTITVVESLAITPATLTLELGQSQQFTATGGVGAKPFRL